jgi:hypothetical protein
MNDELQVFALKTAISEIKNACPDVSNAFIFNDDGAILAKDENTDNQTATRAINVLNAVAKSADTIGGLESATFYSASNRVNVFHTDDYCLAVVGSEEPDGEDSAGLARILVPTVLRLTEKISVFYQEEISQIETLKLQEEEVSNVEEPGTDLEAEEIVLEEPEVEEPQPLLPDAPVTQFMVENLGSLYALSDTVRIDNGVIQQWKDLYGEREIDEVEVETLNGQTTRCKYKPIKDSKHDGRGVIQLPQKVLQALKTSKGELVTVKPVIE